MKNRLLASVLCLLMVVLFVLGLTACGDCEHQWGEWTTTKQATCTEAGTKERKCSECDEVETSAIAALGHDWNEATCSAPKTCKTCSATEGAVGTHAYTVNTVKDEALKSGATCTSGAVYYKSCACGAISTNDADVFTSGDPIAHTFDNEVVKAEALKSEATATMDAIYYKSCDCGAISKNDEDTFNLHVFNQETVKADALKSEATCTAAAVYHKSCVCGAVSTNDADVFTIGSVLPHTYDKEVVKAEALKSEATCENAAVYYKSCACGAISESDADTFKSGEPIAHTYNQNIVSDDALVSIATCKSAAIYHKSCICGAVSDNAEEVFTSGQAAPHDYNVTTTPATCESPAINTYLCECGDTYTEFDGDKLGHNIKDVVPTEKHVEGCEYVLVYTCKNENCGKDVTGQTVWHHNHIARIAEPATCVKDGLKTFVCACGDELEPETILHDPTGHNWTLGVVSAEGKRTDECSVCHETKSVTVFTGNTTGQTDASNLKDTEIELNDANINLGSGVVDQIGDQKVSVSADKFTGDDRKDIGLSDEALKQVGDNPIYNFTISNGEENISDFGEENFVTITLPYELKPGEDVDSIAIWFISDKCQKENCEDAELCEDASHRLVSINATYNNGFVTFKTNHFSYYTVTRLTPAERCELYGHNYTAKHVEGDCTNDSYDLYVCVRCHDKYVDNYVTAIGHVYTENRNSATCTENGSVVYDCDNCDHSYSTKLLATGHDWEIETVESTCSVNGHTTYACKNCTEEYTVTHAKVAHEYTKTVVAPTCDKAGYTVYDCDNCTHSYNDKFVSALGHTYEVSAWEWANDYKSAKLTLVCVNDETHIQKISASIGIKIINGTCSTFVKTIYTAAVSYNGVVYTDEKSTEEGNPDHTFSSDWKHDATAHWHECICGERADVTEHTFENATVTLEPTCGKAGEETSVCSCGEKHIEEIPATGEHDYVNGTCKDCGAEFTGTYYLNLVNSFKSFEGFAIKIKDLSIEIKEKDLTLVDSLTLIGSIKQIDIAELALYIEDGEIGGAAIGSLVIFNGPMQNANAVYKFKAVISEGYVYINLEQGKENATKPYNVKVSLDSLLESMTEEMNGGAAANVFVNLISETIIPALDTFVSANSAEADAILESIFNIIFTFEKQADGTYIATLDYDKIAKLNENLATKPVADVLDIYFGEGSFDALVELVIEILDLELSAVPAYLEECGFDTEKIIADINELVRQSSKNPNFDLLKELNNEEYKGLTLGMLAFEKEKAEYIKQIDSVVEMLKKSTAFSLIGSGMTDEEMKKAVEGIIDMVSERISVSFTTDNAGMLTSVKLGVDEFVVPYVSEDIDAEVAVNLEVEVIINGRINVTWSDIIESIESGIVSPDKEMLVEDIDSDIYNGYYGTVEFGGKKYDYGDAMRIYAYAPDYSMLSYIVYNNDCTGWTAFEVCYADRAYEFTIANINVDGEDVTLIIDEIGGAVAQLVETEKGYVAVYEDGTEKNIEINFSDIETGIDFEDMYTAICFGAFENPAYMISTFGTDIQYYYNAEKKEYSFKTQHTFEYEYKFDGETCEDGCTVFVTCEDCDYYAEDRRYYCSYGEMEEVDLSELGLCGGTLRVQRCEICEKIAWMDTGDIHCRFENFVEEEILDESGNVIGQSMIQACRICGLKLVQQEWTEFVDSCEFVEHYANSIYKNDKLLFTCVENRYGEKHDYIVTYRFNGKTCEEGYYTTRYCKKCEDTWEYYSTGHSYDYRETSLEELGFCGGYLEEEYCEACNTVLRTYVNTWCYFEYLGTDDNGFELYKCHDCGIEKRVSYEIGEKDDKCTYERKEICGYYLDGNEILSYVRTDWISEHDYSYKYEFHGSSCEDGYLVIMTCKDCGYFWEKESHYHEEMEIDRIDLEKAGACYGEFVYYRCPCGEISNFYMDSCAGMWNHNEYYDDTLGATVYVETRSCPDCQLVYAKSYYSIIDKDSCTATYYYTVVINIGDTLVAEREYNITREHHTNRVSATLMKGEGSSCYDGVILTEKCEVCGYENTEEIYHHEYLDLEVVDLAALGSVCGGTATLRGCACGENLEISRDHVLCDFGEEHCAVWIENIITDSQPVVDGYTYFYNNACIYTCAVTDPEQCAFKIRYARYWLKASDECRAYEYETWQFGYNEDSGECAYEITFKTGYSQPYHNYIDTSDENGLNVKLDCEDCGSYYYRAREYYDNGNLKLRETLVLNNAARDYEYRVYESVEEFATDINGDNSLVREYQKRICANGEESWSERTYTVEDYQGPFGDSGYKIIEEYNSSDKSSSSTERAYVIYKNNTYMIYEYRYEDDYWAERDFEYSFDGGCFVTETFEDSNGKTYKDSYSACNSDIHVNIKEPTCSQTGMYGYRCSVCENISETYEYGPNDHDWYETSEGHYCCYICGLENANGASGNIVMEDMTKEYGNSVSYVVGYYVRDEIKFTYYISIILSDGSEKIVDGVEAFEVEGLRAFAFSKAAVAEYAEAMGYTDYEVRFTFVPEYADGSFDYALTFTEKEQSSGSGEGDDFVAMG